LLHQQGRIEGVVLSLGLMETDNHASAFLPFIMVNVDTGVFYQLAVFVCLRLNGPSIQPGQVLLFESIAHHFAHVLRKPSSCYSRRLADHRLSSPVLWQWLLTRPDIHSQVSYLVLAILPGASLPGVPAAGRAMCACVVQPLGESRLPQSSSSRKPPYKTGACRPYPSDLHKPLANAVVQWSTIRNQIQDSHTQSYGSWQTCTAQMLTETCMYNALHECTLTQNKECH
jgi:hypothetical protein